jgi:hypothetical protein
MTATRCTMPTSSLRMCQRTARYEYIRDHDGTSDAPDVNVAAYCTQHMRAGGHSRMLRPPPWEYTRVYDRVACVNVAVWE